MSVTFRNFRSIIQQYLPISFLIHAQLKNHEERVFSGWGIVTPGPRADRGLNRHILVPSCYQLPCFA